jgi:hypothetical protein
MTVPLKVYSMMDPSGVGRKFKSSSRNQQTPVAQKRMSATKDIESRRLNVDKR